MLAAKLESVNEIEPGSVKLRNKPVPLLHSTVRRR
jgi:hypothetical protein